MARRLGVRVLVALAGSAAAWGDGQSAAPFRIFLRGGPKTHGPAGNGLHDHEVWVKTWQPLRGVMLRGIAWAGKRDVDLLATREETEALRD